MFTGIIQAIGKITGYQRQAGDVRLRLQVGKLDMNDVSLGDSIAVQGVCLTVVEMDAHHFSADVSQETLSCTTLGEAREGQMVNLEKALTPSSRLGGHLVSGHVDGIGQVLSREAAARSEVFRIKAPDGLARYIAHKGSICVDGISLTVNAVNGAEFDLNIVPHTLAETTLSGTRPGNEVNLEVDLLARYLERLMLGEQAAQPQAGNSETLTEAVLARYGFLGEGIKRD